MTHGSLRSGEEEEDSFFGFRLWPLASVSADGIDIPIWLNPNYSIGNIRKQSGVNGAGMSRHVITAQGLTVYNSISRVCVPSICHTTQSYHRGHFLLCHLLDKAISQALPLSHSRTRRRRIIARWLVERARVAEQLQSTSAVSAPKIAGKSLHRYKAAVYSSCTAARPVVFCFVLHCFSFLGPLFFFIGVFLIR